MPAPRAAPAATGSRSRHPALLLALANLLWAGNFVVGRAVAGRVPPLALSFWRWAVALLVLLPLAARDVRAHLPALRRAWPALLGLGLLGVGAFNTLVYLGLRQTTATNAVLLNSACPAFILVLAALTGAGRPGPRQLGGIALSLAGVLAIAARGDPAALRHLAFGAGDLWVLAAVLAWAGYTVLLPRRPAGVPPLALLAVLVAVGLAAIAPLYAWELSTGAAIAWSLPAAAALAYVGVMPSVVAYASFNAGVAALGPQRAAVYLQLLPAFGSILAALLLGEAFRGFHAAGIGLILAGVALAGGGRPAPPRAPPGGPPAAAGVTPR